MRHICKANAICGDLVDAATFSLQVVGVLYSSGGKSLASRRGGPGSSPSQVMCDLWWTKWHWYRFSPTTSVYPANLHSTNCSTIIIIIIIIIYHPGLVQWTNSGHNTKWTHSHPLIIIIIQLNSLLFMCSVNNNNNNNSNNVILQGPA
jgi:hypothetical protein